ncbi:MAG: hypothetical protein UW99_C0004G0007 [Candidatus Collierbacteria bacterium GW2011_GWC2_45_15]|uniref:Uncharacterized protein n=1 Tax=Candidatus Collierbacteria bacterium GW2011_GWC2_45_15 TaxID=1618394 RepID=A0A0G1LW19_9BACT|nr:MAG: hypothetical protein UW99_C0004G0007 [Candidatus Collierbacteria bacterium GW2011_GWC2_45_15]
MRVLRTTDTRRLNCGRAICGSRNRGSLYFFRETLFLFESLGKEILIENILPMRRDMRRIRNPAKVTESIVSRKKGRPRFLRTEFNKLNLGLCLVILKLRF